MTDKEAKAFIHQHMTPMTKRLGLSHFEIAVEIAKENEGTKMTGGLCARAQVEISDDYESAVITLYPNAIVCSAKDLFDTLRHELFHILLHPFVLMEEAGLALANNSREERLLKVFQNHAAERMVANLERTDLLKYDTICTTAST